MKRKLDQSIFNNAPDWAKWAAVNVDGYAFFYEIKPTYNGFDWRQPREAHCLGIGIDFSTSERSSNLIERKFETNS